MDEAEFLADRVAVISKGVLKICGTTSFLKRSYGQCYYLEVEQTDQQAPGTDELLQLLSRYNNQFNPDNIAQE